MKISSDYIWGDSFPLFQRSIWAYTGTDIFYLAELILELKHSYTIVVIEHDMRFLFRLADRISVIHWGQVIASGTPEELQANKWVRASNLGKLA